ncbi:MAG: GNAT family N-acetyltransferase [Lachnospiraceae bacterium]|jgi:RimJ/RimL family protein N-acetyltransferase|nr:GNAT family N-acetyltransferase [Lachnospiraceae bacterium]
MISSPRLKLREINESDACFIVSLRSDPDIYRYFKNPHAVTLESHIKWYKDTYLPDKDRIDWIAFKENEGGAQPALSASEGRMTDDLKVRLTGRSKGQSVGIYTIRRLSLSEDKEPYQHADIFEMADPGNVQQHQKDAIEIGYMTAKEFQGMGYAKEAVSAIIEWAVKNFNVKEAVALIHPDNAASKAFIKNLGFACLSENNDGMEVYESRDIQHFG